MLQRRRCGGRPTVVRRVEPSLPFVGINLITPLSPAFNALPTEKLTVRGGAASLDDVVKLVWLLGVFLLPRDDYIDLASPRRERPYMALDAEQN